MNIAQSNKSIPGFRTPEQVMERLYEYAELPTVSTGFPLLDELLQGGLRATQLHSLAAGTGKGKTSLALQIASHHAAQENHQGGYAVIWTLEMDDFALQARMVAQRAQIPSNDVLHGKLPRDRYRQEIARYPRLQFYDGDDPVAFKRLVERIDREAKSNGITAPTLVIVDYLQKLARPGENPRDAITRVSEVLRKLAQSLRVVLLVVSSVSRESAKRIRDARHMEPDELVDVCKESGAIEYDTAVLLVLGQDTGNMDGTQTAVISVAKNRFGRQGQVEYRFEGASGLFKELGQLEPKAKRDRCERRDQITEVMREAGEPLSKNAICDKVTGRKADINREIDAMVRDGELVQVNGRYALGKAQGDDSTDTGHDERGDDPGVGS